MRGLVVAVPMVLGLTLLGGCPNPTVDDPEGSSGGAGGTGSPCSIDGDCTSGLCVGGVCAGPNGSSSSGVASSSGGGSSQGAVDAGAPDSGPGRPDAGPLAHIVLSPDGSMGPLEFGATRIGAAVTQNVIITNTGTVPASIVSLAFSGNTSGEFTLTAVGGQPAMLGPADQLTVRITHTAADASADNAFFSVVTNADNPLVQLPLTAAFKGDPTLLVTDAPTSTTEVTTLQVPATPLGEPITAHLFLKNVGAADSALAITSVTLDPPASALFAVSAGTLPRSVSTWPGVCADLGGCSAGAAECREGLCFADAAAGGLPLDLVDVAVAFNAATAGEASVALVVTANVAGTTVTRRINIAAIATENRLDVTPNPIAFGDVFVGRTRQLQVTLKNPDDATNVVNITDVGIRFTPAPFVVAAGGVPAALTPGSSVVINVTFSPLAVSTSNNSLAITRQGGQPIYIPITAAGVDEPQAQVSPQLDFGGVVPGNPRTLPLAINNIGFGALVVSNAEVTPASAPFSVLPTSIASIAGMGTQTLQVSYTPSTPGETHNATLLLTTNDPDAPLIQVALSGQSVLPGLEISRNSLDFGPVLIGSNPAPQLAIVVRNSGMGSLNVGGQAVVTNAGGTPIGAYNVQSSRTLPTGIQSGDAITITVTFAPGTNTVFAGNLTLTTNDPGRPTVTIPVTGTGHNCAQVANASVTVVNGTDCSYQCFAETVQCDADTCVSCPTRHAANRSCGAGDTCQYTCPPNSGETDPPNTCAGALNLGNVQGDKIVFIINLGGGTPYRNSTYRLPRNDTADWFRFKMKDRPDSLDGEDLSAIHSTVRLTGVAQGEQLTLEVYEGSCSGGVQSVTVGTGQAGEIETREFCDECNLGVNGMGQTVCVSPKDDSVDFWVAVKPQGDSWQCSAYTLEIETFEEPFRPGCIF